MTRMSKPAQRRHRDPHKNRAPSKKSGSKKDNLPEGFKPLTNAFAGSSLEGKAYIHKLK